MGFSKVTIKIILTKNQLLDLAFDDSITISFTNGESITLSGMRNHQKIPGMLEGESVMYQFETTLTRGQKNFQSTALMKLGNGGQYFSGRLEYEDK